jgi:hypothetical protein
MGSRLVMYPSLAHISNDDTNEVVAKTMIDQTFYLRDESGYNASRAQTLNPLGS